MSIPKKHHYVPITYLESWATDNMLCTCKKEGFTAIRKQHVKEVANKKNLYLLGEQFYESRLFVEKILFPIYESMWPPVKRVLVSGKKFDSINDKLKSFVICQAFRTPKFFEQEQARISRFGKNLETPVAQLVGAMIIQMYPEYIKNSTCTLLKSIDIGANFITCDNPATHWVTDRDIWHHVNGLALNQALDKNKDYRILCPVSPKYCAIVSVNLNRSIPKSHINHVLVFDVTKQTVHETNLMIKGQSDKMLFAKHENDLYNL